MKNSTMLTKISTAWVVLSIAAVISLSGVFWVSAQNGYGYGYGYGYGSDNGSSADGIPEIKNNPNVSVNGSNGWTETPTTETPTTETPTTETPTTETPTTERIEKVMGSKKYSITNNSCIVSTNIANPNYTSDLQVLFKDIDNSEYKNSITRLAKVNSIFNKPVVYGTKPTTFEPSRGITRAEFLAIVLQAHCVDVYQKAKTTTFTDLTIGDWKTNVVTVALSKNLISGDTRNGKKVFRPDDIITKIEAMAILVSMRDITIDKTYEHGFEDSAADWQDKVLSTVEYLELEKKSKKFSPNSSINRDDMANYIVKTTELY